MASALTEDRSRDFWTEVKMRGIKSRSVTTSMDTVKNMIKYAIYLRINMNSYTIVFPMTRVMWINCWKN